MKSSKLLAEVAAWAQYEQRFSFWDQPNNFRKGCKRGRGLWVMMWEIDNVINATMKRNTI